jgi:hypothetical protein
MRSYTRAGPRAPSLSKLDEPQRRSPSYPLSICAWAYAMDLKRGFLVLPGLLESVSSPLSSISFWPLLARTIHFPLGLLEPKLGL